MQNVVGGTSSEIKTWKNERNFKIGCEGERWIRLARGRVQ